MWRLPAYVSACKCGRSDVPWPMCASAAEALVSWQAGRQQSYDDNPSQRMCACLTSGGALTVSTGELLLLLLLLLPLPAAFVGAPAVNTGAAVGAAAGGLPAVLLLLLREGGERGPSMRSMSPWSTAAIAAATALAAAAAEGCCARDAAPLKMSARDVGAACLGCADLRHVGSPSCTLAAHACSIQHAKKNGTWRRAKRMLTCTGALACVPKKLGSGAADT